MSYLCIAKKNEWLRMKVDKKTSIDSDIPLHRISDFAPLGVSAHLYGEEDESERWDIIESWPIHRDDHYFFLIVEDGYGYLDIDFQRICLKKGDFYAIAPGQLHGNVEAKNCKGWVILVATEFISKSFRDILGRNMFRISPHILNDKEFENFRDILNLIVRNVSNTNDNDLDNSLIRSLTETFVTMAVKYLSYSLESNDVTMSRKYHLAIEFKELVRAHCISEKSVQFYADALNITSGYLNEVLKTVTGQPTTYWIQEEILLEARRLLVATTMSAKEIAYHLGYDNYSYFNRIFHDKIEMTPLQFRAKYLK